MGEWMYRSTFSLPQYHMHGREWSASRSRRFAPRKETTLPIEVGGVEWSDPQNHSGQLGEEKKLLILSGLNSRPFGRPATASHAITTARSLSLLWKRIGIFLVLLLKTAWHSHTPSDVG